MTSNTKKRLQGSLPKIGIRPTIDGRREGVRESLEGLHLTENAYYIIELSLLEICINIIRYAYPEEKGEIFLRTWEEDEKIFLEIRDNGIPFDPTESEAPDIDEILKNERKGGLGIFLARELMDGFSYERKSGQNVLTMYKTVHEEKASG